MLLNMSEPISTPTPSEPSEIAGGTLAPPTDPVLVTTRRAAEICGVHVSTVKRWCEAGELPCEYTEGGHRRIRLLELTCFADDRKLQVPMLVFGETVEEVWSRSAEALERKHFEPLVLLWFDWLMRDQPAFLAPSMELLLDEGMPLPELFDQAVAPLGRRIGEAWHDGRIRISDEHRSTQHILDALHGLRLSPARIRRPVSQSEARVQAIVGAAEGNEHMMAAFMLRLVLEDRGIPVIYLGANVPGDEFGAQQFRSGAGLICASLAHPQGAADAQRLVRNLAQNYAPDSPYHVVMGGSALVGEAPAFAYTPFRSCSVMQTLSQFATWLDDQGLSRGSELPAGATDG